MGFLAIFYVCFASICYLAHGNLTAESALFNIPLNDLSFVWVPFSYGLALIFGFSI